MKKAVVFILALMVLVVACGVFTPTEPTPTNPQGKAPIQLAADGAAKAVEGTPLEPFFSLGQLLINAGVAAASIYATHKTKDTIAKKKAAKARIN